MNRFELQNSMLVDEFDDYIREHSEFAQHIPDRALVALLLEDDEEFSSWSRQQARTMAEKNQPVLYVKIKKLRPVRSRIEELAIEAGYSV